jgi:hypothetical protein
VSTFGTASRFPRYFCWTRYGTESGESAEEILIWKEQQRRMHGGLFLWGIGNSVRPAMLALLSREEWPVVVFSPMASKPQRKDSAPPEVVQWRTAVTLNGTWYDMAGKLVTSRRKRTGLKHYALVCRSSVRLGFEDLGSLRFGDLRNLISGTPLGHSQVTAVVERRDTVLPGKSYPVTMVVELAYPYFLTLGDPVSVHR